MPSWRLAALSALFLLSIPAQPQQVTPTPNSQAVSLLQQSLAAQTGGAAITDITLTGTVTFLYAAKNGSGPVTLTALSNGTGQMNTQMPWGNYTQVWSISTGTSEVTGTGPGASVASTGGATRATLSPAWFSPALLVSLASGSQYSSSYLGTGAIATVNANHVAFWPNTSQNSPAPPLLIQQTKADLYIDPSTSLPVSAVFWLPPSIPAGSNKRLTIRSRPAPEEIHYSDYHSVQGRMIPFHIQIYAGPMRVETMDIVISSVAVNTGATIANVAAAAN